MYNEKSIETTISIIDTVSNNIILDNIRTDNDTTISTVYFVDKTKNKKDNVNKCKNNLNIYRYKFSDKITEQLYSFSKIHQYDDRQTFKEAWKVWLEENNEIVEYEIRHLININYEGDVVDKMFKSARYYFRKKSTEKKEPKKRGNYVSLQKELLDGMDNHITQTRLDLKPSDGFNDFCIKNQDILKEEIKRLIEINIKDLETIKNKMKKTYKNRYFLLFKKEEIVKSQI